MLNCSGVFFIQISSRNKSYQFYPGYEERDIKTVCIYTVCMYTVLVCK